MSKPHSPSTAPEFTAQPDDSDILGISTPATKPPAEHSEDPWGIEDTSIELQQRYAPDLDDEDPWASDTPTAPPVILQRQIRPRSTVQPSVATAPAAKKDPPQERDSRPTPTASATAKAKPAATQPEVARQTVDTPTMSARVTAPAPEIDAPAFTGNDLALKYCESGRKALAAKNYAQARVSYKVAIEWNPNLAAAHSGMAQIYLEAKDYEGALAAWGLAIKCDPAQLDFYYQRATISKLFKNYYQVLADCKYILERNPENAPARWLNAIALVKLENYQTALSSLDLHIKNYPQDPNGYCYRGICYERLDRLPQALADLDRAISLQANQPVFHHARGRTRQKMGDLKGALADFNLTISRKPQAPVYDDRAEVHRCLGDREAARKDCDLAIELNPKFINAYFRRGLIFVELGDLELALLDFDLTIDLDYQHTEAYIQRSWIHFRHNDYRRAKQDCQTVKGIEPNNFWANYIAGVVDSLSGLKHSAIKNFTTAIEIAPNYVSARYHRGVVYHDLGDTRKAMTDFEQARSIQDRGLERLVDRDETGFYAEGLALYHIGQSEAARTVLILGALSAKRFNNPSFHQIMQSKIENLGLASGELSETASNSCSLQAKG
ncbi:tetratricopeptide repeat protein [Chamaesiphon minutus]|uniref:Tetratricopeptide repeat protein n=1 Tax=Chamaesiphon minutus (strain ATCC 27169 / PCC 6605) TaxID=1173020 RepID=K9UKH6_CHAP6|nr:tetratricopeptide repeat protein [Chamaesiphon minutus]AFY95300.1 tetratricopeptide repeat protein [Chamaesiphon minutus PCC 6605]